MNTGEFYFFRVLITLILFANSYLLAAKELIIMTDDGPPHMIAESQNGIDLDITKAVLTNLGYRTKVVFAPLARGKLMVENNQADAFLPTFYQNDSNVLFHSDPIIYYRPTVFSLAKNQFKLNKLQEISKKRVISFQGATGYFGEVYREAVSQGFYRELHDMSKFPEMLLKKRVDIVVLDYYIFYYFLSQFCQTVENQPLCQLKIREHKLIPQVSAHVGFNNQLLRDRFNDKLKQFKNLGKDKSIIWRYIGQH